MTESWQFTLYKTRIGYQSVMVEKVGHSKTQVVGTVSI